MLNRYGFKGLQIYNCILNNTDIEQRELSRRTLIPISECNQIFYRLHIDGLVSFTVFHF